MKQTTDRPLIVGLDIGTSNAVAGGGACEPRTFRDERRRRLEQRLLSPSSNHVARRAASPREEACVGRRTPESTPPPQDMYCAIEENKQAFPCKKWESKLKRESKRAGNRKASPL